MEWEGFCFKEELKKGYFDDFGEFKVHKGKVFEADAGMTTVTDSKPFPSMQAQIPKCSVLVGTGVSVCVA